MQQARPLGQQKRGVVRCRLHGLRSWVLDPTEDTRPIRPRRSPAAR